MTTNTGAPQAHSQTTVSCDTCGKDIPIAGHASALSIYRDLKIGGVHISNGVDAKACRHLCGVCSKIIHAQWEKTDWLAGEAWADPPYRSNGTEGE